MAFDKLGESFCTKVKDVSWVLLRVGSKVFLRISSMYKTLVTISVFRAKYGSLSTPQLLAEDPITLPPILDSIVLTIVG